MKKNIKNIKLVGPNGDIREFKINTKSIGLFGYLGLISILLGLKSLASGIFGYGGLYSIVDGGSTLIVGYALFKYIKSLTFLKIATLCSKNNYKAANEETAEFLKSQKIMIKQD